MKILVTGEQVLSEAIPAWNFLNAGYDVVIADNLLQFKRIGR